MYQLVGWGRDVHESGHISPAPAVVRSDEASDLPDDGLSGTGTEVEAESSALVVQAGGVQAAIAFIRVIIVSRLASARPRE